MDGLDIDYPRSCRNAGKSVHRREDSPFYPSILDAVSLSLRRIASSVFKVPTKVFFFRLNRFDGKHLNLLDALAFRFVGDGLGARDQICLWKVGFQMQLEILQSLKLVGAGDHRHILKRVGKTTTPKANVEILVRTGRERQLQCQRRSNNNNNNNNWPGNWGHVKKLLTVNWNPKLFSKMDDNLIES